jgi:hypothetical protein
LGRVLLTQQSQFSLVVSHAIETRSPLLIRFGLSGGAMCCSLVSLRPCASKIIQNLRNMES